MQSLFCQALNAIFKFIKISILITVFFINTEAFTMHASTPTGIYITILTNNSKGLYIGDRNQAKGIQEKLAEIFEKKGIKVVNQSVDILVENDVSCLEEISKIEEEFQKLKGTRHLMIGIGEYGLKLLKTLKQNEKFKETVTLWSAHQVCKGLEEGAEFLDIIILPKHNFYDLQKLPELVLDTSQVKSITASGTELILTTGVAHFYTEEKLKEAYLAWEHFIPKAESYLLVVLGGDAPNLLGEEPSILYYTEEEAIELARYSAELALENNSVLLITSGSRTGLYNHQTTEKLPVHNPTKNDSNIELDSVTKIYVSVVKEKGVPFVLFDFQNDKIVIYSSYTPEQRTIVNYDITQDLPPTPALTYAVKKNIQRHLYKLNDVIIAGESISSISEIGDNLPPQNIYMLESGSMNKRHIVFNEMMFREGRANILTASMKIKKAKLQVGVKSLPAAELIARRIEIYLDQSLRGKYCPP